MPKEVFGPFEPDDVEVFDEAEAGTVRDEPASEQVLTEKQERAVAAIERGDGPYTAAGIYVLKGGRKHAVCYPDPALGIPAEDVAKMVAEGMNVIHWAKDLK